MSLTQTMPIMITQIVAMFLMMGIGAIIYKKGMIDTKGAGQLANICLYVASPAILLRSLATVFDAGKLVEAGICAVISVAFTLLSAGIARLVYRDRGSIAQIGITVSNMGFIGIPLVQTVLGEEYVFYISVLIAAQVPLTWSYGVWLITRDPKSASLKKVLTNPAVIAVFVGFLLFLCSIELKGIPESAASSLASLNTGLAMIILGVYLAQADLRALLRSKDMYRASFLRLVVAPLACIAILFFLPLAQPVKMVVLIGFAAPCGTVSAIFPQMFGGDYRLGAGIVSTSTLLSLVSMPIMLAIGLAVL